MLESMSGWGAGGGTVNVLKPGLCQREAEVYPSCVPDGPHFLCYYTVLCSIKILIKVKLNKTTHIRNIMKR